MKKIALLIGVSEFIDATITSLPAALRNINAVQSVLSNAELGGFDDVQLLENPDRAQMEEAIDALFRDRQKEDLVLLYFSGHGIKDDTGKFSLVTRITEKQRLRTTTVAVSFIHDVMTSSRSQQQVVILDCCSSGDIKTQLGGENRAVLTSSTTTEYSFTHINEDLSLYTNFLVEGLRTGAADIDCDGNITVGELHNYVKERVQSTVPIGKPEIYAVRESYEIIIARAPSSDPKLVYRKQVERLMQESEGGITVIGRDTLDELRINLNLSLEIANAIEAESLQPYYYQLRSKVDHYRAAFEAVVAKRYPLSARDRLELQRFQQVLNLRHEDVAAIEAQLLSQTVGSPVIASYEQSLQNINREQSPAEWAEVQSNLANAYFNRTEGDRAENLEQAIAAGESALQVYNREAFPEEWAATQMILGKAYLERIQGDRPETLEQAITGLLQALRTEDASVRRRATDALGKLGSEQAVPALLQALNDEASGVRWRAVDALGRIGSEQTIPGLLQSLNDEDYDVRWRAVNALGNLGSEQVIPELLQSLNDAASGVRWRTVEALGKLGSEAAIPGLLQALEDQDAKVRSSAAEAVEKIALSDLRVIFTSINLLHNNQDYETAIALLDRVIQLHPENAELYTRRGDLWHESGRYEEAIASYDQAIAIQPDVAEVWSNRGNVLTALRRYEEAIASYDRALEIQPDLSTAWNSRGVLLAQLERYEEAITCYDRALEIRPDLSRAWDNRGEALDKLGRYEEAIASFDQALQHQPDIAEVWQHRGKAFKELHRFDEAVTSFNRAIELKPYFVAAIANRGDTYRLLSSYEEALQDFNRAIEIEHQEAWLFAHRGQVFLEMERYEEALTDFNRAIELDPNNAQVIAQKAQALAAIERYEEARQSYENALAIFREKGDRYSEGQILSQLGSVYLNQGQWEGALSLCQQSLDIARQLGDHRSESLGFVNLADIYQILSNYRESGNLYEHALAISKEIGDQELEASIQNKLIRSLLQTESFERAIAVAQSIPDHERRLEILTGMIEEVRRLEGDRSTELLSLRSSAPDLRVRQLIRAIFPTILILDDEREWLIRYRNLLEIKGFYCLITQFQEEAVMLAETNPSVKFALIDDILLAPSDINAEYRELQHLQGYDVVRRIQMVRSDVRFIFTYSRSAFPRIKGMEIFGAVKVISKEDILINPEKIYGCINNLLKETLNAGLNVASEKVTYSIFLDIPKTIISIGEELEVTIELRVLQDTIEYEHLIEIPYSEVVGNELHIFINAAGFQVEGDGAVSLPLDLDTNTQRISQTVSFRLIALRPGSSTITAEVYRGDTFETTLEDTIQVNGLEKSTFLNSRIKTEPRPVSQPDLILQVQTLWNGTASTCTFRYHLRSFRASSLLSSGITYQSQLLSGFWLQQVHKLLQNAIETLSDALPSDGRSHLTSLGHYLFQHLFPIELQTDLRNLNRYQAHTLLILADQDAQFPWTLLHNGQEFLGERFILGHWLWDLTNTQPYEFPVGAINVAHYANVEQPEVWATLLEPPGAPPPYILTGGVLDDLGSMEAMRGLHLIRLGQSAADAELQDAPVPLDIALEERDIDQKVRPIKLNLRRNRPLVTLGYLRQDQPELTSLQQTWAATFIRAGCSAFVGALWAVNPATEAAFISSFYHALWTGDSLGGAFQTARRLARAATPDSLDWLAYLLFGDPMARPYRPVQGQGYAVVEPIGQDIDDPVPPGTTIRFRVSLRRTPPVWHEERVIEVAENLTFNDLQAHIVTFGLEVTPATSIPLKNTPLGIYTGTFYLTIPLDITEDSALVQVYFADGMQTIHTLTFPLTFQQEGEHPA